MPRLAPVTSATLLFEIEIHVLLFVHAPTLEAAQGNSPALHALRRKKNQQQS
jgi:hypothetical protein